MFKEKIPDEYKLILLSCRLNPSPLTIQKIKELLNKPLDWEKIKRISAFHDILPFLYYNLNKPDFQSIIPQGILTIMKQCYYNNLQRNLSFEKEIFIILELLHKEDIAVIPLKGFSLIYTLYKNPGLRIMADVDILVKKDGLRIIKDAFEKRDFRESPKNSNDDRHMAIFLKTLASGLPVAVEIHGILAYSRPYEIKMPELWQRVYLEEIDSYKLPCLSIEDTFLSLVLHLRSHTRRLKIKFIIDIAELLNVNKDRLDWDYIIKIAKDNHIMTSVYFFIYIAKDLLDADIAPEILGRFQPNIIKTAIMRILFKKSNFYTIGKIRGACLRFLLFDSALDFIIYLWRVSFLERFVAKRIAINNGEKIKK